MYHFILPQYGVLRCPPSPLVGQGLSFSPEWWLLHPSRPSIFARKNLPRKHTIIKLLLLLYYTAVYIFIYLVERKEERQQLQQHGPTLGLGTSFPSAETIAQLAGLFPKDGPSPSPGRLRPKGADLMWSELLEANSTSSQRRCQDPPCASVRTTVRSFVCQGANDLIDFLSP